MLPPSPLRIPLGQRVSRCQRPASAGLSVHGVLAVLRAVLLQLEPVGVVAPVLAGDVVAVLALLAGQGDLRTYVGGCHGVLLALPVGPPSSGPRAGGIADTTTDPRGGPWSSGDRI